MVPYRIIAVDPGYGRIGIAVLEKDSDKETLIFSECYETSAETKHPERLQNLQKRLCELLKEYHPSALALETLFFSKNKKTALAVAEARGVILSEAAASGIAVFEYQPAAVKIAVTGYGHSDKKQIQEMVVKILNLTKVISRDDEYDAIAVGLTHLASYRANVTK
ncbi:MAG TPA: crossover junction endodeoxyribonuclease RuvC [Candidatus Paceibacterota bacterium]